MKTKAIILLAMSAILFISCSSSKQVRVFGEEPSLRRSAAVAELNSNPTVYVDQDVLITGTVVDMCAHAGCWVEVEQKDKSKILCKSIGDVVTFPQETLGKQIELQGTLMFDPNAPGYVEEQHDDGSEGHACPAPQIMVSIKGARVIGL